MVKGGAHNDGVQTKICGPAIWFTMHMLASSFPLSRKQSQFKSDLKQTFIYLLKSFPCKHCRSKLFVKYLKKKNFQTMTRRQVEDAIFKIHNSVNKKLKKPIQSDEKLEKIRHFYRSMKTGYFKNNYNHSTKCGKIQIKIVPQSQRIKSITGNKKCLL